MKAVRTGIVVVAILAIATFVAYRFVLSRDAHGASAPDRIAVFYTKVDGQSVVSWPVTLGAARDPASVAFYAATQAVAGPASDVSAIRFPAGTIVRHVNVRGAQAVVDLGGAIAQKSPDSGSFSEAGEFKALVWTMTALPDVTAVRVLIDGASVAALPGGQYELDEPLTRAGF